MEDCSEKEESEAKSGEQRGFIVQPIVWGLEVCSSSCNESWENHT